MDQRDMYHHETYHPYRAKALMQHAEQERLAISVISGQRRLRFYYPAIARFGGWLIVFGRHLRKHYGDYIETGKEFARTSPSFDGRTSNWLQRRDETE